MTVLFASFALLGAVGYLAWMAARENGRTYKNETHRFALTYPAELDVREYGTEDVVFGIERGERMDGVVEARILTIQGQAGQSLEDALIEQLKNLCAADGPTASFACVSESSIEPYTTTQGEQGFAIVLDGMLTQNGTKDGVPIAKGPYYALVLGTSATISKVLVVSPPLNVPYGEAQAGTIRAIAESVSILP